MSCLICLEPFPSDLLIYPCPKSPRMDLRAQENRFSCCVSCFNQYLETKFATAYEGSCPSLTCPFCTSTSDLKCLISEEIFAKSSGALYHKYSSLASSLLSIQCSSCHTRKTVFISTPDDAATGAASATLRSTIQNYDQFQMVLKSYDQGIVPIRTFFDQITAIYCPSLLSERNDRFAFAIMKNILLLIKNSERRANLHLRYIQFRPRVWSPCCDTAMCFKCKTKSFHEDQTCEEVTSTLSNDMLPCGQCGVSLVKGDGCDSIVCVCGHRFAWSEEFKRVKLSSEFSQLYPKDTAIACVTIMSSNEFNGELKEKALSWSRMYKDRYDQALLVWYFKTFGYSASQLTVPVIALETHESSTERTLNRLPENFRSATSARAVSLWTSLYPQEHHFCTIARNRSNESLFYTLFPAAEERCLLLAHAIMLEQMKTQKSRRWKLMSASFQPNTASFKMTSFPKNDPLIRRLDLIERASVLREAQTWYQGHQRDVHDTLVKVWAQRVNQFLVCYGHLKVQFIPSNDGSYDCDVLQSTISSDQVSMRSLEKNDRVKLRGVSYNSTVVGVYSDGLVGLRHDNGDNGLYKRERIVDISLQCYLPFLGISNQHLDNFISYLLFMQSFLQPETFFLSTEQLLPLPPPRVSLEEGMRLNLIQIIESLDFMTLTKINFTQSLSWNDLMVIVQGEGLKRSLLGP